MKRSGGVTAFAILFIIFGLLTAVGALFSFVMGPTVTARFGQTVTRLENLEDRLRKVERKAEQEGVAAEDLAEQRQKVEQSIQVVRDMALAMRETLGSPTAMGLNLVNLCLGLAAFIAGIGILMLKGWARSLIVWQAALSIVAVVVALVAFSGAQDKIVELQAQMVGEGQQEFWQMGRTMGGVGQGIGLVWIVAWNGLVLRFFNRPSVKAQFVRGR